MATSRKKRSGVVIALSGLAFGGLAIWLWPQVKTMFQQPTLRVLPPTITRSPIS